jgi:hypothetical protein
MGYRALAVAVLGVHFAYLLYVVLGGFLAWRWPRTVWVHLAAVGWGVALVALGLDCPLTYAQDWARQRAGQPALTGGFVDQYIEPLYPRGYTPAAQALVACLVIGSWIGHPAARRGLRGRRGLTAARRRVTAARRPPRPARSRWRSRTRSAGPAGRP